MLKQRKINIYDIYDIKIIHQSDSDFVVQCSNEKKIINLHCNRYQAEWIADELWKYIDKEESEIKDIKDSLNKDC